MSKNFTVRKLTVSGACIALAFVLSYIRLFHMPTGGSVTLLSMLFASLPGYFFGPMIGLCSALAYSILQFVQNPEAYSVLQVLFDYFFAFTALGISGFFNKTKNGLFIGYAAAILARIIFSTLASYFFWSEYLPEGFPSPIIAALVYNASYIGTEGVITLIILFIPPVNKLLKKFRVTFNR